MKKLISTVLTVCIFCIFALPVMAADETTGYTAPDSVSLDENGRASFTIVVSGGDQQYAGAQVQAVAGSGVKIDSVSYNQAGNVMAPRVSRGTTYFSVISVDNTFQGDVTCTVNVSYTGSENSQILIKDLCRYRVLGPGSVDSIAADASKTIALMAYTDTRGNSENPNLPGPIVDGPGENPGGPTDNIIGGDAPGANPGGVGDASGNAAGDNGAAATGGSYGPLANMERGITTETPDALDIGNKLIIPTLPDLNNGKGVNDIPSAVNGGLVPTIEPIISQPGGSPWFIWIFVAIAVAAAGVIADLILMYRKRRRKGDRYTYHRANVYHRGMDL